MKFKDVTGISTVQSTEPLLQLFPNPSNDLLHITFDGYSVDEWLNVTIKNAAGKWIMEEILERNESLDIRKLVPGIYYVAVIRSDKQEIHHAIFVKQ